MMMMNKLVRVVMMVMISGVLQTGRHFPAKLEQPLFRSAPS